MKHDEQVVDHKRLARDPEYWKELSAPDDATHYDVATPSDPWMRVDGSDWCCHIRGKWFTYLPNPGEVERDFIPRPQHGQPKAREGTGNFSAVFTPGARRHGLPPVGTTQDSGVLIRHLNPRPAEWEILAHKGDEAVLYDTTNPEQAEVYLLTADCFTTEQHMKDREELIDVLLTAWETGEPAEVLADRLLETGWHR